MAMNSNDKQVFLELRLETQNALKRLREVDYALHEVAKSTDQTGAKATKVFGGGGGAGGGGVTGGFSGGLGGVAKSLGTVGLAMAGVGLAVYGLGKACVYVGTQIVSGLVAPIRDLDVAMDKVSQGLREMDEGLMNILHGRANQAFTNLASQINKASGGIFEFKEAIDLAKAGKGAGMTDEDVANVGRLTANLSVGSSRLHDMFNISQQFVKAWMTGEVEQELAKVDANLFGQLRHLRDTGKELSKQEKQLKMREIITARIAELERENNYVLQSGFAKTLAFLREIKSESEGLMEVWASFGSILSGAFTPLKSGLMAFQNGILSGMVGSIFGGGLSLAIAGLGAKATREFGRQSKGGKAKDGFNAFREVGEQITSGMMEMLFFGELPKEGVKISEKNIGVLAKIFNTTSDAIKSGIANVFKAMNKAFSGLEKLGEGFLEGLLNIDFEAIKKAGLALMDALGSLVGVEKKAGETSEGQLKQVGQTIAKLIESMVLASLKFAEVIVNITKKLKDAYNWITAPAGDKPELASYIPTYNPYRTAGISTVSGLNEYVFVPDKRETGVAGEAPEPNKHDTMRLFKKLEENAVETQKLTETIRHLIVKTEQIQTSRL